MLCFPCLFIYPGGSSKHKGINVKGLWLLQILMGLRHTKEYVEGSHLFGGYLHIEKARIILLIRFQMPRFACHGGLLGSISIHFASSRTDVEKYHAKING